MSRLSSLAAAVALALLAGCGGDGGSTSARTTPAPTVAATTPPTATASAQPTTPTETTAPGAKAPSADLSAPDDGDKYLEGSDARAKFSCKNATACGATVAKAGAKPQPVQSGDALPTKPGRYTFELVATGADGRTARASAGYEVPNTPGSGGGDTRLPPGTPEGGP